MKNGVGRCRRMLSILLAMLLAVSCVPQTGLTVRAEEMSLAVDMSDQSIGESEAAEGQSEAESEETEISETEPEEKDTETEATETESGTKDEEADMSDEEAGNKREETAPQEEETKAEGDDKQISDEEKTVQSVSENAVDALGMETYASAVASGTIRTSNYTWTLDAKGKLTVTGEGNLPNEWGLQSFLSGYSEDIKSIEVNITGMTNANWLFGGFENLSSVDMSGFDTSSVTNMQYMFYGLEKLARVDMSGCDLGNVTNMSNMFGQCTNLTNVEFGRCNTGSVTDMSNMFDQCYKLTQLNLGSFDTHNVTNMARMFSECSRLSDLDLSGFDTHNVTNMEGMFYGCQKLVSLDVSSFHTGNVTTMKDMFDDCGSLKKLDLSNFNVSKVNVERGYGLSFYNCTGLTELNLSGIDVRSHGFDLSDCRNLVTLYTPYTTDEKFLAKPSKYSPMVGLMPGKVWYDAKGERYDRGVLYIAHSIKLTRDKKQAVSESITVQMNRSIYACGDTVAPADLTVMHYGSDGTVVRLAETDYSIESIDMSVPGRKRLVVTYDSGNGTLVATTELTVACILTEENTKIELAGNGSYAYDGKKKEPVRSVAFQSGENETALKEGTDYKVYYRNNLNAGDEGEAQAVIKGTGVYSGTLNVPFTIVKADIPDETLVVYATECQKAKTSRRGYLSETFAAYGRKKGYEIVSIDEDNTINGNVIVKTVDDTTGKITSPHILNNYDQGLLYYDTEAGEEGDFATITVKVSYEANYNDATLYVKVILRQAKLSKILNVSMEDSQYNGRQVSYQTPFWDRIQICREDESESLGVADSAVTCDYRGTLEDGSTYGSTDQAPVDAGEYVLTVTVKIKAQDNNDNRMKDYEGSAEYPFKITKAPLTIRADNVVIAKGESAPETYTYQTTGLVDGEKLITGPTFAITDTKGALVEKIDTEKAGSYYIIPKDADVGNNYDVSYQRGLLTVAEESVVYSVTYNYMGHGDTFAHGITAGGLLEEPEEPKADGYRFGGWYKDQTFAKEKVWDFNRDTAQGDMTLYACWLTETAQENQTGIDLYIQDILPQAYTGNAVKPTVNVYDSDGTVLTAGKHYTISYQNNIDVNGTRNDGKIRTGGIKCTRTEGKKEVTVADSGFSTGLPYVVIKGKGNYEGTVYRNFVIERADIADANGNPAPGFTMKYTDQTVKNVRNDFTVFDSLKYKKAMSLGKDYMVTIRAKSNVDADENAENAYPNFWRDFTEFDDNTNKYVLPVIPKGFYGIFTMTVTGVGNYTGTIEKEICVSENADGLIKNATITLGKNQKTIQNVTAEMLKGGITLTPGCYDAAAKEYYAVENGQKAGKKSKDDIFTVSCKNGKNDTYLMYDGGNKNNSHYFISYQANREIGTATMTITGNPEKGYYGSKSVTFKITGTSFDAKTIDVKTYDPAKNPNKSDFQSKMPYTGKGVTQNGVTLSTKVTRTNPTEQKLIYGTHYTISYTNNVKKGTATMVFTANPASGFSGSFKKTFKIEAAKLAETVKSAKDSGVTVERITSGTEGVVGSIKSMTITEPVPYEKGGAKPSVEEKVALRRADNEIVLKEGTDYTVSYKYNATTTQGDMRNKPVMTIKGKGNYQGNLTVNFSIGQASMNDLISDGRIAFTSVQFNPSKNETYQYKPGIKIMDTNGKVLQAGTDYKVEYRNNTQKDLAGYFGSDGANNSTAFPAAAVITVPSNSNYKLSEQNMGIEVPLEGYIYGEKMVNNKNIYIVTDEAVYTSGQCKPKVRVYYGTKADIAKAKSANVTDNAVLFYRYNLKPLTENTDYMLSYGANVAAGKNKGSVTVTGIGRKYGGSITIKFNINKKALYKDNRK